MDIVSTLSQHVYVTLHIPSHITSYMSTRLSCATPHAEKNIIITLMTPLSCNMCIILPQCFTHEAAITHVCVCAVAMYGNHLHNHVGNASGVL